MTPRTLFRAAALAAILAAALASLVSTAPAADADAEQLARQVTIRRTAYGVPHIQADSLRAVAFGFGYCQAEDHLENVMRSMLRARGELAKTFGGEDNVRSDFWIRQFRVRRHAVETYHKLDADFRSMLEGFAAGMNYYVEMHRDRTPDWVPTINGHDVASHGMTGVMRFAFDRRRIIRQFLSSQADQTASLEPLPTADELGSNMWAFAPDRTKSGHAILMGNPHQAWSQVATYYEAHLTVPGVLNFYGSTFVGRPVLTTGWNDNLGWSHTVNYPDLEEIYQLDVDPKRSDHYLFDGSSLPFQRESVAVDEKTENGLRRQQRTFWHTPLGPVIHRTEEHAYVLRSAAYDEFRFYQQWLRLAQAKDYDEFRAALEIAAIPMFNICYADRQGNIYYLWNGTVPKMPHPAHSAEPVPARGSADIWTHFHGIDELPQLFNPKGGYVHNSNSPPYLTNLHEPLPRENYPDHFPANRLSLRSQHSLELIHNEKKFSLEEVRELKHSPRMLLADRVKDDLVSAVRASDSSTEVRQAADVLAGWDNTVKADSRGGVLFTIWWSKYAPNRGEGFAVPWSEEKPVSTPSGLSDPKRAVETFREAVRETKERFGAVDVAWGDVHRVRKGDVDLPMSGGGGGVGCFRVAGFREADDGKLVVSGGDSWVFCVEFGDNPRAYTIVGYSQSEVPGTPHFSDQAALYSANQMKPAAFTEAQIQAQLEKTYHPGEE